MKDKTKIEENELVSLLQKGDKDAFDLLYSNYSSALYGIIYRILQKEDIAGDVLQDVFVKVWKKIDSYDTKKGTLYTWMLNIARNTAIDNVRKIKREGKVEIQTFEEFVNSTNVHQTSQKTDHIGLKTVVDELEPELKIIIDYLYFGGYTQKEVSDELGLPLGTVKTRSRKAIKILRGKITNFIFWI